ncbi:MAG TPA: hypothetical protein VNH18_24870 [Bryobacteraceae bacterium]|nr:hypothetical protein [Bryobacteraceae bacterium]
MPDSPTNLNKPPDNAGLDYMYLRTEGVNILQRLSSSIWTDYNEHDPGVTTLEQLCYALTELSYRAELDVAQLLVDRETGTIQPHRHALFIPRRILPCNPVTVDDYRKRIVDLVPEVRNVWLTPSPNHGRDWVNGSYEIRAYVPECSSESKARIARKIRRVYCRHRNLCEDVHAIHILEPLRTTVHAEVTLAHGMASERALATIFFQLGKLLTPELQRRPLAAMILDGYTADQIFNGPLLTRGFISDSQLQPQAPFIAVTDIIAAIASTPGVAGTRNVRATLQEDPHTYCFHDSIPVPVRKYLDLNTSPDEENRFSIRLVRDGVTCLPDPGQVAIELALLWDAYRNSYPLKNQYDEYFPLPVTPWQDLTSYYSIQNQYPGVYGINSFGPPASATNARRAQAKQLKAYLLPFEQLMADYFAQIANISTLFSIYPESLETYAFQSLVKSVPDVLPVLRRDYHEGLAEIVSGHDPFLERRDRFLDFLLSLYASPLNPVALFACGQCSLTPRSLTRLVRAKFALLRKLVAATRDRGRAIDYLDKPSRSNFAGMQLRCRIELGLGCGKRRRLCDLVGDSGLKLARRSRDASLDESAERYASHIRSHFRHVASYPEPVSVPAVPACLRGNSASDEFISEVKHLDNLLVGTFPDSDVIVLVCNLPPAGWTIIGRYPDLNSAIADAHAVARHCHELHRAGTQLYIVEHNLLRFGRLRDADNDRFQYDFTLTAIIGLRSSEWHNRESRSSAREIIRQNTPAHIVANVCFLRPWSLLRFEYLYCRWLEALRKGGPRRRERTCARLRRFLVRHSRREHT